MSEKKPVPVSAQTGKPLKMQPMGLIQGPTKVKKTYPVYDPKTRMPIWDEATGQMKTEVREEPLPIPTVMEEPIALALEGEGGTAVEDEPATDLINDDDDDDDDDDDGDDPAAERRQRCDACGGMFVDLKRHQSRCKQMA